MTFAVRPELPALPKRIAALPVDERGYPVPWFVQWFLDGKATDAGKGKPDHRIVDSRKVARCLKENRCFTCGEHLGRHLSFPIGPMCAINRISTEPPSHHECAVFSVKACPFLSRPHMTRREGQPPGIVHYEGMIKRNPGVTLIWTVPSFRLDRWQGAETTELRFNLQSPMSVSCWKEGRAATKEEIEESISTGLPVLLTAARVDNSVSDLENRLSYACRLLGIRVTLKAPPM